MIQLKENTWTDRQKDGWKDRRKDGQTLFYRTLPVTTRGPMKSAQMGIEIIKSVFPKLRTYQQSIYPVIKQSKTHITYQK